MSKYKYGSKREIQLNRGEEIKQFIKDSAYDLDTDFILEEPIFILELPSRVMHSLMANDIVTIRNLLSTTVSQLLTFNSFGKKSLLELRTELAKFKLELFEPLPSRTRIERGNINSDPIPILEESFLYLDLSPTIISCIYRMGITTIGDLRGWQINELRRIRNLGEKSILEIIYALAKHNIELSGTEEYIKAIKNRDRLKNKIEREKN